MLTPASGLKNLVEDEQRLKEAGKQIRVTHHREMTELEAKNSRELQALAERSSQNVKEMESAYEVEISQRGKNQLREHTKEEKIFEQSAADLRSRRNVELTRIDEGNRNQLDRNQREFVNESARYRDHIGMWRKLHVEEVLNIYDSNNREVLGLLENQQEYVAALNGAHQKEISERLDRHLTELAESEACISREIASMKAAGQKAFDKIAEAERLRVLNYQMNQELALQKIQLQNQAAERYMKKDAIRP